MSVAGDVENRIRGLEEAEAEARLKAEGYNELPRNEDRTVWRIFLEVLREPMLALLLAAGFIYLFLGDLGEAAVLIAFAGMSVAITLVQETRTERVLEALRDLTSPRAMVIRGGERKVIAGRDVARGDILVLSEGDRVAADCVLFEARHLQADESLLTGESVPVRKTAVEWADKAPPRPGGDDLPFVFSGSMIVSGQGLAEVTATGVKSEIGKIGQTLGTLETTPPRLQRETGRLARLAAVGATIVVALTVILYGLLRGGWLDGVLAGIAIGMSMLPEEIPVVLTVFMAMGAWRISQARVLTRRAASIESLGAATVLCTDKTGTLTENRMTVTEMRSLSGDGLSIELAAAAMHASAEQPFDPMEKAFHAFARDQQAQTAFENGWRLVKSYGLTSQLLAMTQVWQTHDGQFVAFAKGAPEAIASLCGLNDETLAAIRADTAQMAEKGLRVLAIARASFDGDAFPENQQGFSFTFLGLAGLSDPLRQAVPQAVSECHEAGIRVVMITGDYPVTARAIAGQAGLDGEDVLTGEELDSLDDAQLRERVARVNVFARIMPEQKLRIVQALKANGEIVAMTGDGVNDAPSLKAADIGIAMGGRGTDVAREASSIVLLNDDFGSIVGAIRLGRRIYDNMRKAMAFIFAVHVPIAGLALLPLLFGMPIIFWPVHIAFLEMVIDPVCSLVFEAEVEEANVMRRPPRKPDAPLFSWMLVGWSLWQGGMVLAVSAGIYFSALHANMPDNEARALTFFTLVLSIISLILINRSFSSSILRAIIRPNRVLVLVLGAVGLILAVALKLPAASELFRFGPLHAHDLTLAAVTALGLLILAEFLKRIFGKYLHL